MWSAIPSVLKLYGVLALVLTAIVFIGINKCSKKAEDKARIEHNNKKRDAVVEKEVGRVEVYEQKEKVKSLDVKRIKPEDVKKIKRPTKEEARKIREKQILELEGLTAD